jgi:hypothetical protein
MAVRNARREALPEMEGKKFESIEKWTWIKYK